ncbi:MAG: LamG-like jellyroll fold domain-containing protein [Luteolibacter sp.]|jgi:hypothetical protein|nr:LamG-like jellyroll fold domain-containing protein [Luteolibacter sp.]
MMDQHRLEVLLGRYFDQVLTPQQREQLEARLESSSQARAAFWEYARIHGLIWELGQQRNGEKLMAASFSDGDTESENDPEQIARMFQEEPPDEPRVRAGSKLYGVLMAIAACLALLFVADRLNEPTSPGVSATHEMVSKAVAVVTGAVNVECGGTQVSYAVGATLNPGSIHLRSGILQIDFYSGARVILEGPVNLKIVSTMEVECDSGKLSADVPLQARGFRINTPRMDVVDLGTSFGVNVNPKQLEVHVFNGEVELHNTKGKVRSLYEGQAEAMDDDGKTRSFASLPGNFSRSENLQELFETNYRERHQRWRQAGEVLNQDPSLLFRFDFEERNPKENILQNKTMSQTPASAGVVVGGTWSEGRWTGKSALAFSAVSDRIRLSIPGQQEAVTFAAWVRVNGTERLYNALFMTDDYFPGALHWQLNREGRVLLGICPPDGMYADFFSSKAITRDLHGQWIHLAVVYDVRSQQVRHYLNGAITSQEKVPFYQPVRLGKAELGNWNPGTHHLRHPVDAEPRPIRNFNGSMDEFAFFTRALSDEEIHQLYLSGSP